MKKICLFISVILMVASCENTEITYKDFDFQSVYFPFQYPVRTLSLGNDYLDNSLDKEHKFNIGISIGGLYANNPQNWTVDFVVDNDLITDYLVNGNGDTLVALPTSYYTMDPSDMTMIPKDKFQGLIEIQLNENFFLDSAAVTGKYVIPLRITDTSADTILSGLPAEGILDPDRNVLSDWVTRPKDYTLFGIKYVNPYHGRWLRRGQIIVRDGVTSEIKETIVIRQPWVERDQLVSTFTLSMSESATNFVGNDFGSTMKLIVSNDNNVTVGHNSGSLVASGSGEFVESGDTWGGKLYDVFHLDYSYTRANGDICEVKDTMVFRDRQIVFEDSPPSVQIPE